MVQDGISQEPFADYLPLVPAQDFSATRVIGGKLRALYDDTPQPCPSLVAQLLRALDGGNSVTH
jgi:hypothetical protein